MAPADDHRRDADDNGTTAAPATDHAPVKLTSDDARIPLRIAGRPHADDVPDTAIAMASVATDTPIDLVSPMPVMLKIDVPGGSAVARASVIALRLPQLAGLWAVADHPSQPSLFAPGSNVADMTKANVLAVSWQLNGESGDRPGVEPIRLWIDTAEADSRAGASLSSARVLQLLQGNATRRVAWGAPGEPVTVLNATDAMARLRAMPPRRVEVVALSSRELGEMQKQINGATTSLQVLDRLADAEGEVTEDQDSLAERQATLDAIRARRKELNQSLFRLLIDGQPRQATNDVDPAGPRASKE